MKGDEELECGASIYMEIKFTLYFSQGAWTTGITKMHKNAYIKYYVLIFDTYNYISWDSQAKRKEPIRIYVYMLIYFIFKIYYFKDGWQV